MNRPILKNGRRAKERMPWLRAILSAGLLAIIVNTAMLSMADHLHIVRAWRTVDFAAAYRTDPATDSKDLCIPAGISHRRGSRHGGFLCIYVRQTSSVGASSRVRIRTRRMACKCMHNPAPHRPRICRARCADTPGYDIFRDRAHGLFHADRIPLSPVA